MMFLCIYEYLFLLDLYDNNYVITTQETHTLWRLLLEACAYILYIVMLPSGSVKRSVYRTGLDPYTGQVWIRIPDRCGSVYRTGLDPESGLESLLQSALHFPTPSGYRHPQNLKKKKSHFCHILSFPPPLLPIKQISHQTQRIYC